MREIAAFKVAWSAFSTRQALLARRGFRGCRGCRVRTAQSACQGAWASLERTVNVGLRHGEVGRGGQVRLGSADRQDRRDNRVEKGVAVKLATADEVGFPG